MACLKLQHYPQPELKIISSKKVLTSEKSEKNLHRNYLYGFNGQEKDDEVAGSGNSYTAEYWEYDSRLGRRWNLDPISIASTSEYVCLEDNPIWFNDPDGDRPDVTTLNEKERTALKNDLEKKTGYTYHIVSEEDGSDYLEIVKGEDGVAKISRDENGREVGSATARKIAMTLNDSKKTYYIESMSGGLDNLGEVRQLGSRTIKLNFNAISSQVYTGGLNPGTNSEAMVLFHELYHTDLMGSIPKIDPMEKRHNRWKPSKIDEEINKIREELGPDYGQRQHYFAQRRQEQGKNGYTYYGWVAYEPSSLLELKRGVQRPQGMAIGIQTSSPPASKKKR
jgi:RHS repeat-associated protein